jgi:hypothetical protein
MKQPPDWQGRERERENVVARAIIAYASPIPPYRRTPMHAGGDGKIGSLRDKEYMDYGTKIA